MFDWQHYVPILKWKRAEMQALEKLDPAQKQLITPFIQILMPPPKVSEKGAAERTPKELLDESISLFRRKLPGITDEVVRYWGKTLAFVDLSLIHPPLRTDGFATILGQAKASDALLVPVTRLKDDLSLHTAVVFLAKKNNSGLCLRLSRIDCSGDGELSRKLSEFMGKFALDEKDVDLVIDYQDEQCLDFLSFIQQIPSLSKWRTLTFACGSFPVDLTDCELGLNYIDRSDWLNWVSQRQSGKLHRIPSFGDYTIQHPIYKESVRFYSPSASIRYTLQSKWLIMRGQKGRSEQYPANARLISRDGDFFGGAFSYGDHYIVEKGKDLNGKPGSAQTWLVAGINHHLACTVSQIASLT